MISITPRSIQVDRHHKITVTFSNLSLETEIDPHIFTLLTLRHREDLYSLIVE
jgi:hypothetical protein